MATGIRIDFSQLRHSIDLKLQQLSDEAIKARLVKAAEVYIDVLRYTIRSRVSSRASGNMEEALCNIVGPWRTARGWAIGVGDINRVGLPGQAPKSRQTIKEFWDWLNKAVEEGDPRAVEAQAERVKARRERKKPPGPAVTARPAHKPAAPSIAQQQRAILKAKVEREAAERGNILERARKYKERLDEIRRQRGARPTAGQPDATFSARRSLVQRALMIRRQIRSTRGRDGASILARRGLRAQLAAARRLLRALREAD